MDNKITSLQPQAVWKYFNAICQVPRPSGHLDKITEYIFKGDPTLEVQS